MHFNKEKYCCCVRLLLYLTLGILCKFDTSEGFFRVEKSLNFTSCIRQGGYLYANYTTTDNFSNYTTVSCPISNITICQKSTLSPTATPCINLTGGNISCPIFRATDIFNIINNLTVKRYVYMYGQNVTGIFLVSILSTEPLNLCRVKRCDLIEPLVVFKRADFDNRDQTLYFSHEQIPDVDIYRDRIIQFGLRDLSREHFLPLLKWNMSSLKDRSLQQDHKSKINVTCVQYEKVCANVSWPYCDMHGVRNQVNMAETCMDLTKVVSFPVPQILQFSCSQGKSKLQTLLSLDSQGHDRPYWSLFTIITQDGSMVHIKTNNTGYEFANNTMNLDNAKINVSICSECQCSAGVEYNCKSTGGPSNSGDKGVTIALSVSVVAVVVVFLVMALVMYNCKAKNPNDGNREEEYSPEELVEPAPHYFYPEIHDAPHAYAKPIVVEGNENDDDISV